MGGLRRLLLVAGVVALAPWTPAGGETAGAPLVSAHRGGAAYAPENTMVAFRNAVRLGVDVLEADAQLTADGHLVLIHDDRLERTTDCQGTVSSTTLADLRRCDAAYWFSPGQPVTQPDRDASHPLRGRGVRVPTVQELLRYVAGLDDVSPRVSIEAKTIPGESNFDPGGTRVAEALVAAIIDAGLLERADVQSFWPPAIEAAKRSEPRLRTTFLTTTSFGQTAAQNVAYVVSRGHDIAAPNYDAPDLNEGVVAAAQAAGKQVIPYTVDRRSDLKHVSDLGVDGIITNFPACLLDLQGRRGPGSPLPAMIRDSAGAHDCPAEPALSQPSGDRPDAQTCRALRPDRWQPLHGSPDAGGALRVVALQFLQDVRHVETYETFRTKMRCLMEEHVVPVMREGRPTLVVYNEDIGLMTLAIGSRGATIREQARSPLRAPAGQEGPLGVAAALGQLNAAYAPQIAAYQARFGPIDPRKQAFVGATDTMARAYSQTFSDIARDYGVYAVASNNQPRYEASSDPADIALFGDPELQPLDEVYVATSQVVTNQTDLWGPVDVHPDAPAGERNLLFRNDKVPLTALEKDLIAIDEGPHAGPEGIANARGFEVAGLQLGFATSLPAFTWGYPFGERADDLQPCHDMRISFMPCMDELGVDVVVQAEANPGPWASIQPGGWQPLEWMDSTWRTVADPSVDFAYNVTAHMVGNLLDLPFDGQTAITARAGGARPGRYVGNAVFDAEYDLDEYRGYVGDKTEFVELAPWVVDDGPREDLMDVAARLAPGSGDELENDYLETAVWADLRAAGGSQEPPPRPDGREPPAATDRHRARAASTSAPVLPATGGGAAAGVAVVAIGLALRPPRYRRRCRYREQGES